MEQGLLILSEKILDEVQTKNTKIDEEEEAKAKEKHERSSVKASTQIDYFLNESFVKDCFQQQNLLSKLNLSDFKILGCEINPLKIRKNKSVIEFKLQFASKKRKKQQQEQQQQPLSKIIVGKWRPDGRGKEIFDLLQEVWHKGFEMEGADDHDNDDEDEHYHLKLYEPIAYFPDYNFMLTSKASGIQLKDMLVQKQVEKKEIETHIMQAASWLAKLHSISLLPGGVYYYSMKEEEEKLNKWSEHLSIHPDFGKQLQSMLSCILKIKRSLNSKCFVLIHNGFHPGNIFVDGSDLTVIDFDHSCISDPAIDLGYFIAKLVHSKREYNLSLNVESLEKRFLEKYASAARMSITTTKETLERVDLYKARSYIRHLYTKYNKQLHSKSSDNKPNPVDFEYWVKKAEECLNRWMKPACICIMVLYTVCDSFGIMPDTSLFS